MESLLHDILINTYNPNHNLRVQAENALQQFLVTGGSLSALINFIGNTSLHRELRQASGLVLKNRLRDYFWVPEPNKPIDVIAQKAALPTSIEEKEFVKEKIVEILLNETDNSIRSILAEAVRVISEFEYPERWPGLVPTLLANIQKGDVLRIYNSLLALRKIAKRYEFKARDDREHFDHFLQSTLPLIQEFLKHILHNNTLEAAQVMRLCFKIYFSATVYILPSHIPGVDLQLWFNLMVELMNKRLPEASEGIEPLGQPLDFHERRNWPWWKLKKWISRIMTHFIQRYGNPRYSTDEDKAFSEYFRGTTSIQLLEPMMNNLVFKSQGAFLTEDVHRCCLTFINNCVEMAPSYKVIKPHLQFLLTEAVFPTLCITKEEIELFNDDPQEFIRKVHNPVNDWLSPMLAATTLLQRLGRYRQKDVLPIFLPLLNKILDEYNSTPLEKRDFTKKDGVLVAVAVLAGIMLDSQTYRGMVVPFLQAHVLPEFKSPVPFIRARACWVIEYFKELDWEEEAVKNSHLPAIKKKNKKKAQQSQMSAGELLQAVLLCLVESLRDPALPVQAAAACSLQSLIEQEGAKELLRPLLPQIVNEYFRIMEETDNESVLIALQGIVHQYGEEIAPLAPRMIEYLVKKFAEYAEQADDEEAAYNATQCLDTIDEIIRSLEEDSDTLKIIEPFVQPLLLKLLSNCDGCFEFLDTAVHILTIYTYYDDGISPGIWAVSGPLITALDEAALDYVSEIMVPILNYINQGVDIFIRATFEGKLIVHTLLNALQKVFECEEGYSGRDYNSVSNILSCLIITAKGKDNGEVSQYIPTILNMVLEKLTTVKLKQAKIRLLEVIMGSFYYNPAFTLQILSQNQSQNVVAKLASLTNKPIQEYQANQSVVAIIFYFNILFDLLKDMDRDFTQRLIVLSFLGLLSLPFNSLPEMIRLNLPSMFQQTLREIVMIEEEDKRQQELDENGEDDGEDDDYDDEEDDGDDTNWKANRKDTSLREIDDVEEPFDDSDPVQASKNRSKRLEVPEGGYDENDDCINAEDEEYRQMLEDLDKEEKVKRQVFMSGEPINDEDDDDFIYTSPIENIRMAQYFINTLNAIGSQYSDPQQSTSFMTYLQQNLTQEDHQRFNEIIQLANQQHQEELNAQQQQQQPK